MYKVKYSNQILGECYLIHSSEEAEERVSFKIDPIVYPIIQETATLKRYQRYEDIAYFKTKKEAVKIAKEVAEKQEKELEIKMDYFEVIKIEML